MQMRRRHDAVALHAALARRTADGHMSFVKVRLNARLDK